MQDEEARQAALHGRLAYAYAMKGAFDQAAINAVLKFKYKPRVIAGQAVEVQGVQNKFTFKLKR